MAVSEKCQLSRGYGVRRWRDGCAGLGRRERNTPHGRACRSLGPSRRLSVDGATELFQYRRCGAARPRSARDALREGDAAGRAAQSLHAAARPRGRDAEGRRHARTRRAGSVHGPRTAHSFRRQGDRDGDVEAEPHVRDEVSGRRRLFRAHDACDGHADRRRKHAQGRFCGAGSIRCCCARRCCLRAH